MKLLDAVNKILPFLGEDIVSSVDESYNPSVGNIRTRIVAAAKGLQAKGYWFNTRTVTLTPDYLGSIQLQPNVLVVQSLDGRLLDKRDDHLIDLEQADPFVFTAPIRVQLREQLDFEDLPDVACECATWAAGVLVYSAENGPDATVQIMQQNLSGALAALAREHLRKMNFNSQNSGAAARIRRSLGSLYGRR